MNPYTQFIIGYEKLVRDAKSLPLGGFASSPRPALKADAPRVLIFSPHPDDECVIGALALRLMQEAGMRVVNVAVTQGSNKARQPERWNELKAACDFLGFDLVATAPGGLEKITPKTREQDRELWSNHVKVVATILSDHKPRAILFPHERDWNGTHIGTHHLVMDALKSLPPAFECYAFETEYWGQMSDPNLMVETSTEDLGRLMAALSFHVGEVKRNPYHVTVPAWMMDNVRRAEVVGGQGGAPPDFMFATNYRIRKWAQGNLNHIFSGGKFLSKSQNPASLLT
jgi:LmbE family N-acetylglucosaminyl deacetylase